MSVEPQPVRRSRKRLSDEVADHVRERIVSGDLAAGEYVRPERLAEQLDLSATPAREGLLALQSEGFLRVEPRRGFVVVGLSPDDVADTFVAHALLAGELTSRASARLTTSQIDGLANLQHKIEAAAEDKDLETVQRLNDEFHRIIYRAAQAPRIVWLLRSTLGYAPRLLWTTIDGWPDLTVHDHVDVIAALRAGDAEGARAAMHQHVSNAGVVLASRLRRTTTDKPGTPLTP